MSTAQWEKTAAPATTSSAVQRDTTPIAISLAGYFLLNLAATSLLLATQEILNPSADIQNTPSFVYHPLIAIFISIAIILSRLAHRPTIERRLNWNRPIDFVIFIQGVIISILTQTIPDSVVVKITLALAATLVYLLFFRWQRSFHKLDEVAVLDWNLRNADRQILDSTANFVETLEHPKLVEYQAILIPPTALADPALTPTIARLTARGYDFWAVPDFIEKMSGRIRIDGGSAFQKLPPPKMSIAYITSRRLLDIFVGFVGLALLLPLLLLVALAIRVWMGPGVIFVQPRVGEKGKIFKIYKFRTMRHNDNSFRVATPENDPRITSLGSWLRRYHIDELPQLWNILKGDMTLIGPRPEQPLLAEKYRSLMPEYPLREALRPGLSGWAQVNSGYAADEHETERKLEYDLYYFFHRSPSLDLLIAYRTILVLFDPDHVR